MGLRSHSGCPHYPFPFTHVSNVGVHPDLNPGLRSLELNPDSTPESTSVPVPVKSRFRVGPCESESRTQTPVYPFWGGSRSPFEGSDPSFKMSVRESRPDLECGQTGPDPGRPVSLTSDPRSFTTSDSFRTPILVEWTKSLQGVPSVVTGEDEEPLVGHLLSGGIYLVRRR